MELSQNATIVDLMLNILKALVHERKKMHGVFTNGFGCIKSKSKYVFGLQSLNSLELSLKLVKTTHMNS